MIKIDPSQHHTGGDTETGGFDPKKHALVEIGYTVMTPDFQVLHGDSIYIMPQEGRVVEPQAAEINGFNLELWMERGAVDLSVARDRLRQEFDGVPNGSLKFWAHNAPFDKRFIDYYLPEFSALIKEWCCTQKWLRAFKKARGMELKGKGVLSLAEGCKLAGYTQPPAHGGFEDSYSLAALGRFLTASGTPYPAAEEAA